MWLTWPLNNILLPPKAHEFFCFCKSFWGPKSVSITSYTKWLQSPELEPPQSNFFFIIICIFITLFQDKGHFSPFSGLPGSLLHATAAACRCAHVSLHSPRWPLCCLQHTGKTHIYKWSNCALTNTDVCNSNKIPVLTYPCLITSLVNCSRKRVHRPLSWTTNFVQTNPEMICSMCWNVQMCCVLWTTA